MLIDGDAVFLVTNRLGVEALRRSYSVTELVEVPE